MLKVRGNVGQVQRKAKADCYCLHVSLLFTKPSMAKIKLIITQATDFTAFLVLKAYRLNHCTSPSEIQLETSTLNTKRKPPEIYPTVKCSGELLAMTGVYVLVKFDK